MYDEDNPDGPDHHWFRLLADELDARTVLDIGCGTGILTVTFAGPGRRVIGVDPSAAMLDFAERRPGAAGVTWVHGDSRAAGVRDVDLAVMSGNVAQHIPDPDFERTLTDLAEALRSGGVLAFESRNPAARAWQTWTSADRLVRGTLEQWSVAEELDGGRVRLEEHTLFRPTGEHVVERGVLWFRSRELIESRLAAAGFRTRGVWRDWHRTPHVAIAPLMVFEAERR